MKRYRAPKAKEGQLLVKYGKADGDLDLFYCWNGDPAMKADTRLLMKALQGTDVLGGGDLVSQLESRGYDITTLKLTIQKKVPPQG